jgi:Na+/melibiose symporter-like transporter
MKQFIITILVLLFTFQTTNCQVIEPAPNSSPEEFYDYHMLKYKKNKNAALICGISGGVLAIGGITYTIVESVDVFWEAVFEGEAEGSSVGPILALSGAGLIGAAITLSSSARKHQKKAYMYISSLQNTVGNVTIDNSKNLGISLVIPLN